MRIWFVAVCCYAFAWVRFAISKAQHDWSDGVHYKSKRTGAGLLPFTPAGGSLGITGELRAPQQSMVVDLWLHKASMSISMLLNVH